MNHEVFVPVTDDMIYNHPERIAGPLIPYEAGMECHEWLTVELNPEDDSEIEKIVKKRRQEAKNDRIKKQTRKLNLVTGSNFKRY